MVLAACEAREVVQAPATPQLPSTTPSISAGNAEIVPTGHMSVPRAVQSSTRLLDGTVLVAGGCSDAGCGLGSAGGSTAEVFDPTLGTFQQVGDLEGFRDDHAALLLADGRVLLAGGWGTDGVLASTERYDPTTRSFSPGPTMRSPRAGFTAIAMRDGRVLLAGGFLDNEPTTSDAEIFDPLTGTMTRTGSMVEPRGAYAAAALPDGRLLFAGGLSKGKIVASAEIYDPATGRFRRTAPLESARYKAAAVTLEDGRVMVLGGAADVEGNRLFATTEIYDPRRDVFSPGPSMLWPRYKLAGSAVALSDGTIFVAGGAPQAERFDPITRRFEPVPGDLGGERLFLTATRVGRDRILLAGGYDQMIVPTDQAWIYESG